ncbi:hypothetical protein NONI108955_01330 [Nocardia ninae]|uniref:Uncharacterized protein n=1 Tax=Nocardia ninae NBRC 108245 TaxID=1210091 RepID=A0A511MCK6_9NOCA|nr:hypothetical protein [Nocardia ninae]GEM38221.1 hypothetical protein NN4_27400 [Nocardia ninae NBRC 108245]
MRDTTIATSRYERIMLNHSSRFGDPAAQFLYASKQARTKTAAGTEREAVIRDVAAGVAAPALAGCVVWMLREAQRRGLHRLRFLSRDGQVFYELARRLAPVIGVDLDLQYVYSSRLTWSLAATDPDNLDKAAWLFNSFMKSNAADLCSRLGLAISEFEPLLVASHVSLDPDVRADQDQQATAMRRFVRTPEVTAATAPRISRTRELLTEYAVQHTLADPTTGLVDAGWTGRMIGSLVQVCETAGLQRPHVLLWGHEPRPTGWTDPEKVAAFIYNTAVGQGLNWRVPDAPFLVETFCMGDHGIVSGYHREPSGEVAPILQSKTNLGADTWGLDIYRSTLYEFAAALENLETEEARPLIHEVMHEFWCNPTVDEATVWGAYPYDSDPAGTATRHLARPLSERHPQRGDRAWLAGALVLSTPAVRDAYLATHPEADAIGEPATD